MSGHRTPFSSNSTEFSPALLLVQSYLARDTSIVRRNQSGHPPTASPLTMSDESNTSTSFFFDIQTRRCPPAGIRCSENVTYPDSIDHPSACNPLETALEPALKSSTQSLLSPRSSRIPVWFDARISFSRIPTGGAAAPEIFSPTRAHSPIADPNTNGWENCDHHFYFKGGKITYYPKNNRPRLAQKQALRLQYCVTKMKTDLT